MADAVLNISVKPFPLPRKPAHGIQSKEVVLRWQNDGEKCLPSALSYMLYNVVPRTRDLIVGSPDNGFLFAWNASNQKKTRRCLADNQEVTAPRTVYYILAGDTYFSANNIHHPVVVASCSTFCKCSSEQKFGDTPLKNIKGHCPDISEFGSEEKLHICIGPWSAMFRKL